MTAARGLPTFDRSGASSVEARTVVSFLAKHLEIERHHITPRASLSDDLGATQIHVVEVVLALEAHFDIDLPEDDVATCKTVEDLVDCVVRARKARQTRTRLDDR